MKYKTLIRLINGEEIVMTADFEEVKKIYIALVQNGGVLDIENISMDIRSVLYIKDMTYEFTETLMPDDPPIEPITRRDDIENEECN